VVASATTGGGSSRPPREPGERSTLNFQPSTFKGRKGLMYFFERWTLSVESRAHVPQLVFCGMVPLAHGACTHARRWYFTDISKSLAILNAPVDQRCAGVSAPWAGGTMPRKDRFLGTNNGT
jgi:hypothetical protein